MQLVERLLWGLELAVVGMGIVFLALYLLSLVIAVLTRLEAGRNRREGEQGAAAGHAPRPASVRAPRREDAPAGAAGATGASGPSRRLQVVLSAAVAAYLEAERTPPVGTVATAGGGWAEVRPRRTWADAGRQDLISARQARYERKGRV